MDWPLIQELELVLLFFCIWTVENLFLYGLRSSPLIGQILVGIVLGPALADIIPFSDSLRLLGKIGVMMLVLESGLSVDIGQVKALGARAGLAALSGVLLPVLLALLILTGFFEENWKTGLSAGAALAPTSLGFSAQLLTEVNQLNSALGQLICIAAVMDDVISLLLLSEIQALQEDTVEVWNVIRPAMASIGSIVIGMGLTFLLIPRLKYIKHTITDPYRQEAVYMTSLISLACLFSWSSAAAGSSDLLGAFLAGLAFSSEPNVLVIWKKHTSQIVRWGTALFFAGTIGFGIPSLIESGGLFGSKAIVRGLLLSLAAIVGKFAVGFFSSPLTYINFMKFSWAMGGRGEFSFLIADEASKEGLLSPVNYSAVVWALLVSSLAAPVGFRYFLQVDETTSATPSRREMTPDPEERGIKSPSSEFESEIKNDIELRIRDPMN